MEAKFLLFMTVSHLCDIVYIYFIYSNIFFSLDQEVYKRRLRLTFQLNLFPPSDAIWHHLVN